MEKTMSFVFIPPVVSDLELPLICDDIYHDLDVGTATMPVEGLAYADIYVNIMSAYKLATVNIPVLTTCALCKSVSESTSTVTTPGRIRFRMVRNPGTVDEDPTYYFDVPLTVPSQSRLETRSMFEKTTKGVPVVWQYRVTDATAVKLSTRFVKYSIDLGEVDL
jgi:hypothetical protein